MSFQDLEKYCFTSEYVMMVLCSWWAEALLKKIPGPDWIFAKMRQGMGDMRIRDDWTRNMTMSRNFVSVETA